ncbi:cysteine desulfurase family protein [Patescibacteria group bacterium]
MKKIYLDNAATTPVRPEVLEEMTPFFDKKFGNPSSFHSPGKEAKDAMENAREKIAKILDCRISEIIFTAGGTESDNLAILGVARTNKDKGKHIITSKIEHPAVLRACEQLEHEGFEVSYINVDKEGLIKLDELKKALRKDTILVSIMYANNEIGTIEPIKEVAKLLRDKTDKKKNKFPYFHTDACQAAGVLDINILRLGVDLLTFNGSKIYGPKGIGTLFIKKGVNIKPLVYGGGQESGLRGGTENVPAIVGLAKALEFAQKEKDSENKRLTKLRSILIEGILKNIKNAKLNGHPEKRLPNNINISIPRVEGEAMVLYLDSKGVFCSTGSACSSNSLKPSHVLLAIGRSHELAHNSLRFTLGKSTTKADIDYVIKILPGIVKKLTEISSL